MLCVVVRVVLRACFWCVLLLLCRRCLCGFVVCTFSARRGVCVLLVFVLLCLCVNVLLSLLLFVCVVVCVVFVLLCVCSRAFVCLSGCAVVLVCVGVFRVLFHVFARLRACVCVGVVCVVWLRVFVFCWRGCRVFVWVRVCVRQCVCVRVVARAPLYVGMWLLRCVLFVVLLALSLLRLCVCMSSCSLRVVCWVACWL